MTRRVLVLLACLVPAVAAAQNTPVVFVHGLNSSGATWQQAADHFARRLAITPHRPDLPWREPYRDQAAELQRQRGSLPESTIAVAHSNGGVVSREWSRSHRLGGIVTVGTPHLGAPLVGNMPSYLGYMFAALRATWIACGAMRILESRAPSGMWSWTSYQAGVYSTVAGEIFDVINNGLTSTGWLGLESAVPVLQDMRPGSGFLVDLNSGPNLSREASDAPVRIGVVSSASPLGGPFRVFAPGSADAVGYAEVGVGLAFIYMGLDVLFFSEPGDPAAFDAGVSLIDAGVYWIFIDDVWCWAVSAPFGMRACVRSDGVVPEYSQVYPGGINFYTPTNAGPAHNQETESVNPWIEDALVNYMHLAPAGSGSTGPTGPPPPPSTAMTENAGIRCHGSYSDWGATYMSSANACYAYCASNNADACEWEQATGGCWVEFGEGCYVQSGFGGWWAATLTSPTTPTALAPTTPTAPAPTTPTALAPTTPTALAPTTPEAPASKKPASTTPTALAPTTPTASASTTPAAPAPTTPACS